MKIQVNVDKNLDGSVAAVEHAEAVVAQALSLFKDRITRVEVHLRDDSAGRTTTGDKRCMIEARVAGEQPVAVVNNADTVDEAIAGAATKLGRVLASNFGRKDTRGAGGETTRVGEHGT